MYNFEDRSLNVGDEGKNTDYFWCSQNKSLAWDRLKCFPVIGEGLRLGAEVCLSQCFLPGCRAVPWNAVLASALGLFACLHEPFYLTGVLKLLLISSFSFCTFLGYSLNQLTL